MSVNRQQYTPIFKAGDIRLEEVKGKVKFFAYNHQRGKLLHIGSLIGQVYEKVCPILRQPEPSFSMTQAEYGAVQDAGAEFIRIIPPDKSRTFSIGVRDFRQNAEAYYNGYYGPQWRVPLAAFSSTSKVAKRNPMIDSPVIERPGLILPREQQLSLFGGDR